MKKIVQGKQLNTKTAKMIGIANIDTEKDIVEVLHRSKAGVYFIHNTYRKSITGKLEVGEDIYLITANEAKEWAKKWLTPTEYDRYFGETTPDQTVSITVNVTAKAYNLLKCEKELTSDTYGKIISDALESIYGNGD